MRRMNNLVTLFTAGVAFFFGCFITTLLINVDQCPTRKSGIAKLEPHPDIFLIILVFSPPEYTLKRQAMRQTWLKLATPLKEPYFPEDYVYMPKYDKHGFLRYESIKEQAALLHMGAHWLRRMSKEQGKNSNARQISVKTFFAVGTADLQAEVQSNLQREQNKHKDMLLLPRLYDSYENLTEKLLHAFDALSSHYSFSYLLKVDDDSFVKISRLLNELVSWDRKLLRNALAFEQAQQPQPELYWGYFNGRANIKTRGPWRETNYFLANRYISYALGGGYVVSRKIVEFISTHAHYLSAYTSEDVSLGTWLAPLRYVYRRHDVRFDTAYMPRICKATHLVLHKRNETEMFRLLHNPECPLQESKDEQRPKEYYYDWTKPADKCCDVLVEMTAHNTDGRIH